MRRRLAAFLIVPALALTACGGGDKEPTDGKSSSSSPDKAAEQQKQPEAPKPVTDAAPMPTVKGETGKQPQLTIPKGEPSGKFVVKTVSEGDGPEVKKGDLVMAGYEARIWKGAQSLGGSYGEKAAPPQVIAAGSPTVIPAFAQGVLGQKVGSRVLVVAPPAAAWGPQGKPEMKVGPKDNLVFVLDVQKIIPKKAEGKQKDTAADMPKIQAEKEEAATITIPKNDPPKKLVADTLIEGDGAEVKKGQTVYMQYSGAAWKLNEGKPKAELFDASWKTGAPFVTPIGAGQVIPGWDEGLVGKKVGSRVLLVIPPEKAYGKEAKGETMPANSTLVFVVDILAAM
ncbi:FKBP-type peptidyl-prolyl cis-trans isomerase [Streptomyces sp. NPDC048442]|uniref:FKBP-type peptidyl-prolyl cis-trans isomerase n=1 Tax=Streptomyces sp. NPDC048442 TaxID=3154823 RepID=UPI00341DD3F0